MIEQAHGLTNSALEAIADLERRVVAADGGRLKLEWGLLNSRPPSQVSDLLWWDGESLLGFLGIYGFNWEHLELTGMVDPAARRRGIARELVAAALPLCRGLGKDQLLMVVPRTSPGGREFAQSLGMTYEHSEHALRLPARPDAADGGSDLGLRQATQDDIPYLSALYLEAFGHGHVDPERLLGERSRTLMIARSDETMGTIAVAREDQRGAIYGFVVGADWRGRGIGREVLRTVCQNLFDAGVGYVDLEVEVENDHALALYSSVGFAPMATDDYYELRLS